jgi:hemoglobin
MKVVAISAEPAADQCEDLDSRAAIHDLVVGFYREILFDELLEPVFGEVAEVDWALYIPELIDLRQPGYGGSILEAHQHVHDLKPLRIEHFERWYGLWIECVDARWHGPRADLARSTPHGSARRWHGA